MNDGQYENRVWTIPNAITFFRLLLIPLLALAYAHWKNNLWSAAVVALAGLSDIADGFIARHLHMESKLGRVLDPAVDKAMQATMCLLLIGRYPVMLWVLVFFGVKELVLTVLGYRYMCVTGIVNSARWYGKASSIVQYVAAIVLMTRPTIREFSANVLIGLCIATHAVSLLLYVVFYLRSTRSTAREEVAMRTIDWGVLALYLLFMAAIFLMLFTTGDSYLHDVLWKPLFLFLRFASIVGVLGIPAFFLGEKIPREKLHYDSFLFRCHAWEDEGRFYEKIGIQWWKTHTPDMSKFVKKAFPKQGGMKRDPESIRRLIQETCSAELVHWILICLSPVFVFMMKEWGVLAMVLYAIGNMVSLIIQRYNRPRLVKLLQRIEKRNA